MFLLYILGCCTREGYTLLDESLPPQPIDNLDVELIDIKGGYCYNNLKKIVFHIISICMLGIPYLVIHWSITLKLFLLMTPCPLSMADIVLVTVSI